MASQLTLSAPGRPDDCLLLADLAFLQDKTPDATCQPCAQLHARVLLAAAGGRGGGGPSLHARVLLAAAGGRGGGGPSVPIVIDEAVRSRVSSAAVCLRNRASSQQPHTSTFKGVAVLMTGGGGRADETARNGAFLSGADSSRPDVCVLFVAEDEKAHQVVTSAFPEWIVVSAGPRRGIWWAVKHLLPPWTVQGFRYVMVVDPLTGVAPLNLSALVATADAHKLEVAHPAVQHG
ncbi:hypothetical protein T484DRAFT_1849288 [Baffinella frigidus]|nr:hypothetical protein T484DRAFT_1849288 [Cryptophyta sp. CCMP2293]